MEDLLEKLADTHIAITRIVALIDSKRGSSRANRLNLKSLEKRRKILEGKIHERNRNYNRH